MKSLYYLLPLLLLILTACSDDGDIDFFSLEQDLALGQQTHEQILANPDSFPILDRATNPAAYAYLDGLVADILRAGDVPYQDEFAYEAFLIDQDVQNAFATPGGFLYVYTGLVTFLETESELAGVMAHEIAHAAERHSTDQLTQQYGLSTLIALVTNRDDPGLLANVAGQLASLRFSRGDEEEADDRSVDYLCNSRFAADGSAGFFERSQDAAAPPEFLSTHPNPANRVESIEGRARENNCNLDGTDNAAFERFRALVGG